MEVIKEALEKAGFEYVGPCSVCGGRGFDYRKGGAQAKLKKDSMNKEVSCTLSGTGPNGRRIIVTRAIPQNITTVLIDLGLYGNQEETAQQS